MRSRVNNAETSAGRRKQKAASDTFAGIFCIYMQMQIDLRDEPLVPTIDTKRYCCEAATAKTTPFQGGVATGAPLWTAPRTASSSRKATPEPAARSPTQFQVTTLRQILPRVICYDT
ncbi:hypothetical protein TcasGA2_TC013732 [Tribolium castaneum]|uniref:Uncharacterized protein n=1 Tax=Tribolium castaneum TaxID=7070 RepID=D6WJZ2_TRICA|nr:hypothetical protein TcasGA2_TC013732 [Tribolium castaneum]